MPPVEYVRYGIWLVLLLSWVDLGRRGYRRWQWYEAFIHQGATNITRYEHIRHAKLIARFFLASVLTPLNLFLLGVYTAVVALVLSAQP